MNEVLTLLFAGVGGVLLGTIFFGGLWWTVRKGILSDRAAWWFVASRLLRTAIVLAGFYLISQRDWRSVLACLSGFLVARMAVMFFVRKASPCV